MVGRALGHDHLVIPYGSVASMSENILFPGRRDYTGPLMGWFGLLHHSDLYEMSRDVMERVEYVMMNKPSNEIAIRLHNMIYLGGCHAMARLETLNNELKAKCETILTLSSHNELDELDIDLERRMARNEYWVKRDALQPVILAYIREHIPDCAWNGQELVFEIEL
jgi:hypothetical protein